MASFVLQSHTLDGVLDVVTDLMEGIYSIREIGGQTPPVRFAVQVDGIEHRIFSYFPVGSDFSLAVHSYLRGTHTYRRRIHTPVEQLTGDQLTVDVREARKAAVPFVPHKDAFHQSGVLNTKNRQGQRMDEQDDVQSIPFHAIREAIRLCYFYPTLYERYPEVCAAEQKHHNVFRLVGRVRTMPSVIEIRLYRQGFDLIKKMRSAYPGFAAFVDQSTLAPKGLGIMTVFRESPNPCFPSVPAFFKEFY